MGRRKSKNLVGKGNAGAQRWTRDLVEQPQVTELEIHKSRMDGSTDQGGRTECQAKEFKRTCWKAGRHLLRERLP